MLPTKLGNGALSLPYTDYTAKDEALAYWVERSYDALNWSICCSVRGHNLCLLSADMSPLKFDTPDICLALFGDHEHIKDQWNDWQDRIRSVSGSATYTIPNRLSEVAEWSGSASSPC